MPYYKTDIFSIKFTKNETWKLLADLCKFKKNQTKTSTEIFEFFMLDMW